MCRLIATTNRLLEVEYDDESLHDSIIEFFKVHAILEYFSPQNK